MKNLDDDERELLIKLLQKGDDIPVDFKYKIFPTKEKEYDLVYQGKIRKEDLLADEDGTSPVPLQLIKSFNEEKYKPLEDGWENMIVLGDNLNFLKNIYENKDPLIKDKVKGKVKLIYIDPPFATLDEFQNNEGAKAYNDRKNGAEFIEFLRRRLIVAREILADDGSIYVHLDQKMSHYIKIVMDEIFGKNYFINEIIWHYYAGGAGEGNFSRKHENIFYYGKTKNTIFNTQHEKKYQENKKPGIEKLKNADREWIQDEKGVFTWILRRDAWYIPIINPRDKKERTGYPTQKPEALLARIIEASSNEGDIILDFFGGSGTTMAVAEKLGRKWITCDYGKFSYFTMQKRILQIQHSPDLNNRNKKYDKDPKSFITAQFNNYDLKPMMGLDWTDYKEFVSRLFKLEINEHRLLGFTFEAKKGIESVKIFDYQKFPDATIDESYLKEIHNIIGNRIGERVYIVAPATCVNFLADYHEIGKTKYYFLKIPYHVIEELHNKPFRKLRQPKSRKELNIIDEDVIGFHFISLPEVKSDIKKDNGNIKIIIESFLSKESEANQTPEEMEMGNFELLSAVYIDKNHDGENFVISDVYFSDELQGTDVGLEINIEKTGLGKQIMLIYIDIFGNSFKEILSI